MDRAVALKSIVALLECFRQCFTRPGFYYFEQFVQALWLETSRRTTTQVWRFAASPKHFTNFHRFLKTYRWTPDAVGRQLLELTVARLGITRDAQGKLVLNAALDDTLARKYGRKLEGAGWQYDAMAPNPQEPLAFGHCWVVIGLLWPAAERWWFLAWRGWLFRPPKVTRVDQQETKLALVARQLQQWKLPAGLRLRLVADAAYGKRALTDALWELGHTLVSRLPANAVVYEKAAPRPVGGPQRRGKPRKYGTKRPVAHFGALAVAASPQRLTLYGSPWRVRLSSQRVLSRALGGSEILLVAIVRETRSGKLCKPIYLFSTELTLTAEEVVTLYAARFAIELGFRDLKNQFGLGHYQARSAKAAERHVALALVAYTCSQLLALSGSHAATGDPWRAAPAVVTTGQLRQQIARERRAGIILEICEKHGIGTDKREALYADLLRAA